MVLSDGFVVYFQAYTFFWGKKPEHIFLHHSPFLFEIGVDFMLLFSRMEE